MDMAIVSIEFTTGGTLKLNTPRVIQMLKLEIGDRVRLKTKKGRMLWIEKSGIRLKCC